MIENQPVKKEVNVKKEIIVAYVFVITHLVSLYFVLPMLTNFIASSHMYYEIKIPISLFLIASLYAMVILKIRTNKVIFTVIFYVIVVLLSILVFISCVIFGFGGM
jgi:hypothetical protein